MSATAMLERRTVHIVRERGASMAQYSALISFATIGMPAVDVASVTGLSIGTVIRTLQQPETQHLVAALHRQHAEACAR